MGPWRHSLRIISNKRLQGSLYHLILDGKKIKNQVKPGQFLHMRISSNFLPFSRRPFSVFRAQKDIEILYDVVGVGTSILTQKKKGEILDVEGPLGTAFRLPPSGIKQVVMIAGGVGIAPFLMLTDALHRQQRKYEILLLYGARNASYIFSLKEFRKNGCRVFVATEDGSQGIKGQVTKLFPKIQKDKKATYLYTCGPRPMMAAVQEFALAYGLKGQASCEEVMACGIGACFGCVIPTVSGYKRVCYEGPVFDLHEVLFKKSL